MDFKFSAGSKNFKLTIQRDMHFGFGTGGSSAPPEPSRSDMVFTNHPVAIAKTYGHFQAPIVTPYGIATKEE